MKRRALLAAGGAGIATLTAGCNVLAGEPVTLGEPTVERDDDGRESYRRYRHDGTTIAVVTVDQGRRHEDAGRFPLDFHLAHSDVLEQDTPNTVVQRFRLAVLAERGGGRPPAEIAIHPPGGENWPAVTFETSDDSWTVLAAEGLEKAGLGEGTLTIETEVQPLDDPIDHVAVAFEARLAGGGTRYRIDDRFRFEPR